MENNQYINIQIPEYIYIRTDKTTFTKEDIKEFVETFKNTNKIRNIKLYDAYKNKSIVDGKEMEDTYVPNHKIKQAHAKYITNMATSYFAGVPTSWKCEDEEINEIIQAILVSNDDGGQFYKIAKNASIYGICNEMYWRDEEAHFRYTSISPLESFVVYDATIECRPVLGIRIISIYQSEEIAKEIIEVSDDMWTWSYVLENGDISELNGTGELKEHLIGCVPIAEGSNNLDKMSDFETELSSIEALNIVNSNTANDIEAFTDAYLVLKGYTGTEQSELAQIKKDRTLLLDDDGAAEFLVKPSDDTMQENFKKRLETAIHKLSQVPNLTDESFANNLSGVAIRFKLLGLDALAGEKEQMMRELFRQRLEAISKHLHYRGLAPDMKLNTSDYVKINFHRNLPQNLLEQSQVVQALQSILSEETLLGLLPFIEDVADELERKKKEAEQDNTPSGPFFTQNSTVGEDDGEEKEQ